MSFYQRSVMNNKSSNNNILKEKNNLVETSSMDDIVIDITNDLMFKIVLEDPKICKLFLQTVIPDIKIGRLKILNASKNDFKVEKDTLYVSVEKTLSGGLNTKAVRLDVYAEDDNSIFNVEMQKRNTYDLVDRVRYYEAKIDNVQLMKGEKSYKNLKSLYMIFVCDFDIFGKNNKIYTVERTCKEFPNLNINNKVKEIFLNLRGTKGKISKDLEDLLKYMGEKSNYQLSKESSELVKLMNSRVLEANKDKGMVEIMKTTTTLYYDGVKAGMHEGREEGRAEGIKKGSLSKAKSSAKKFFENGVDISIIAKSLDYPESTIKEWIK